MVASKSQHLHKTDQCQKWLTNINTAPLKKIRLIEQPRPNIDRIAPIPQIHIHHRLRLLRRRCHARRNLQTTPAYLPVPDSNPALRLPLRPTQRHPPGVRRADGAGEEGAVGGGRSGEVERGSSRGHGDVGEWWKVRALMAAAAAMVSAMAREGLKKRGLVGGAGGGEWGRCTRAGCGFSVVPFEASHV